MAMEVYWVPKVRWRLAIAPRPAGGDALAQEAQSLREQGVDVLVSLLTAREEQELDLDDEVLVFHAAGINVVSLDVPDHGLPDDEDLFARLVERIALELQHGKAVCVHCRAGIGRSPLTAACVLARLGMEVDTAFALIAAARGWPVPDTTEQRKWAERLCIRRNWPPPRGR